MVGDEEAVSYWYASEGTIDQLSWYERR
jgi:hypothetical protein